MEFSMEKALAHANAVMAKRTYHRSQAYELHYGNDGKNVIGKITGLTIKQVIAEFRELGTSYKYAFVTKKGDFQVLRYFNRDLSKKFFALTRNRKGNAKG